MRRTLGILIMTAVFVMTTGATAFAGMIPVVTFDEVPTDFQAGSTYLLDYTITAHGREVLDFGETAVRFHGPDGQVLTFDGVSDTQGRWTAEVTLPEAGEWRWEVAVDSQVLQSLGTLSVAPASAAALSSTVLIALRITLPIVTLLAVVLLVAQLLSRAGHERQPAPLVDVV